MYCIANSAGHWRLFLPIFILLKFSLTLTMVSKSAECVSLPVVPQGKFHCKYCKNNFEKDKSASRNANAIAAGRVTGVDPIEQIAKRCTRTVETLEADVGGCVLCRLSLLCFSYQEFKRIKFFCLLSFAKVYRYHQITCQSVDLLIYCAFFIRC